MARQKTIRIREVLTTLLPRETLEKAATAVGLTQRQRKVRVHAFFWTLVLGFGTGRERTIAGLRRAHQRMTGVSLVASAFYDRFTPTLVRFLRHVVGYVLTRVAEPHQSLRGLLHGFRDLVLADATVVRLHDLLGRAFPSTRTNLGLAALKLHVVMSVNAAGPRSVKITSERRADGPVFTVGKWVLGRLLLFDLAYFRYQLFSCIARNGGYFIVRLKKSADPLLVGTHRRWRGRSVALVGRRLSEVRTRLQRQVVDAIAEVNVKGRVYRGVQHTRKERFRLVGVRDPLTHEHHFYLTNIPPDRLSPKDIAQTYAARWIVELFFRELKMRYRAEEMPSRKRHVVEALIYATVLTFTVSRALLAELRRKLKAEADRVPDERWAAIFRHLAHDVLEVVLARPTEARILARKVEATMLHEAVDPNLKRTLLRRRVESGLQYAHRLTVGAGHA
jgi:IS4 transposase